MIPGLLIVRPDEMVFFANAGSVRDAVIRIVGVTEPGPRAVLLDLSLTPDVDVPTVEALESLHRRLASDGVDLWLCNVRPAVGALLERLGSLAVIARGRVHPRVVEGVLAFMLGDPEAGDRVAMPADLLAYLRERREQPGTSEEGIERIGVLEGRLARELAAGTARPPERVHAARAAHGPRPRPRSACPRRPESCDG